MKKRLTVLLFLMTNLFIRRRLSTGILRSGKKMVPTIPFTSTLLMQWAGISMLPFEAENFKQVTQLLYVMLTPDEKLINHPVGYTSDAKQYDDWLQCGLDAYESLKKRLSFNNNFS